MLTAVVILLAAIVAWSTDTVVHHLAELVRLARLIHLTGAQIMAGEKELAERVKALETAVVAALENIAGVATEAATDIAKIHDLLDPGTGTGADVDGANAALDAIESKLAGIGSIISALKEQVDRPEPGDEAPPV